MECRVRPPASLLLLLVAASFVHAEAALQKPKHIVHWNVTNKMFASFGDVEGDSAALRVDPFDSMEVRCPYYPDGPDSIPPEDREDEYLIVYQVSEFAYMDCLLESKAKMILMCNESKKQLYSTVTFRPFSPLPDGTDYKPGTTYYWITTSSGEKDGIKNSNKGLCMENNMRLRIEVASEDRKEETTTTASEDEEDNDDFRTRDVNPRFRLSPADVAPHPHRMRHNSEKTSRETKESVGRPLADEPSKETEETSHIPKTEEEESYWRKFVKAFDDDQRRYVSELAMSGKEGTYKYIIEDASAPRGPLDPVPIYAQHHKDTNNVNEERSVPSIHGDYLVDESGSPDGASGKTACLVIFFLGFMALL